MRLRNMDNDSVKKKIEQYEHFIEEILKRDLKDIEMELKKRSEKYQEWQDVKNVLKTVNDFKEKDRDMVVQVNLNNDVMVMGEISDYEQTYINIGLGCLLEMDREEANKYSDIRLKLIKKEIEHFRQLAINVKVHIKLTLLAINELHTTL